MAIEGTYEPSAWSPIAEQVRLYEASRGTEGTELEGQPCVILWTKGRRSGSIRKSPLMRVTDGERYAVIASLGGSPKHPVWYLNLVDDPRVSLQDGAELEDYTARVVDGEERAEWWKRATAVWPHYDEYQTKTDRVIPVVVLDPA
jgi:deazaflavin-dependent oxidoreductase (nitroreductase family)